MTSFISWLLGTKFNVLQNNSGEYEGHLKDYDSTYDVLKDILKLVGLRLMRKDSDTARLLWNIFYWFEIVNIVVALCLEVIKMVKTGKDSSSEDAMEIFRMLPCMGYVVLAVTKSYKIVCYAPIYENLITELRDMWPVGTITKEEHRIIQSGLRQLNYVIKGYYWCNASLLVIFLSSPIINILKRAGGQDVDLTLPFFYWLPFDSFKRGYYEITLVVQIWHTFVTIWFMLSCDLLFCIFLNHITTQFDLLSLRINNFIYVPVDQQLLKIYPLGIVNNADVKIYNDIELENEHHKELSEILLRHQNLIRLAGDVEEIFSFALLINFSNSSIIICFCGLCSVIMEKWNEIVYKSFMLTALSQMWLLCWYGQRLLESSQGVSDALYNSGWYRASMRNRNSILIMIQRAQRKVCVTTYGFSVISLASYTTVIKTAYSYFTLLLRMYEK